MLLLEFGPWGMLWHSDSSDYVSVSKPCIHNIGTCAQLSYYKKKSNKIQMTAYVAKLLGISEKTISFHLSYLSCCSLVLIKN